MTIDKSAMPISTTLSPQVVFRTFESLRPNPHNTRIHSKRQIKQIAKSIRAFGHLVPILIDENGVIIAGHGRYEAAELMCMQTVPTIVGLDPLSILRYSARSRSFSCARIFSRSPRR